MRRRKDRREIRLLQTSRRRGIPLTPVHGCSDCLAVIERSRRSKKCGRSTQKRGETQHWATAHAQIVQMPLLILRDGGIDLIAPCQDSAGHVANVLEAVLLHEIDRLLAACTAL